ncbi:MAG: phage holin family protein [Psychroflexus sp.]|nr:phage holin family protein [Psychroflexus sp.]MDN6309047.1 phage holin family protein [Psychroflexus sp.]
MRVLLRLIISAIIVVVLSNILPGVDVDSFLIAVIAAAVISMLNLFVKPILVILTLPVTIVTFGLFVLVINAIIILLGDWLIAGFQVDGFWWAMLFSVLLSLFQSIVFQLGEKS